MKVLVTGANGFLGRSVVRALQQQGDKVRAFLRPGRTVHLEDIEIAEGDLADMGSIERAVRGVDAVVHAAARVTTGGTWEEFAEANVRGTRRVLIAARKAGVKAIVHISSLSVYAIPADGVTVTEDSAYESETQARGGYSRSKLAADRIALYEARSGAPVVVLRPGLLYGPGKVPPLARQSLSVGPFKLLLARRHYRLPLSYVDNVADAVSLALRCPAARGQAFTIVDANVLQSDFAAMYRAAAAGRWRAVYLPVGAVAASAWVAEKTLALLGRRSPVTYHQIRRATDGALFDCRRAREILGWTPRVHLREGLEACFAARESSIPDTGAPQMVGSSA